MCYSARIVADYRKYVRMFDAGLSLNDFVELFWNRNNDAGVRIPKAMETPFADATSGQEGQIRALIDEYVSDQKVRYEQEVFKQRTRLAAAERKLASKPTKSAAESQRIASSKIDWAMGKLADLRRTDVLDRDSRIFPGW